MKRVVFGMWDVREAPLHRFQGGAKGVHCDEGIDWQQVCLLVRLDGCR